MLKQTLFFDTECYPNYFLIVFKSEKGYVKYFELDEKNQLNNKRNRTNI